MLEMSFIIALTVLFLHATTWEGMIFQSVSRNLKNLPWYIKKPLYDCPICMSIWYGSLIIIAFGLYTDYYPNPLAWALEIFIAGGINTVLIYIVSAAKAVTKKLKRENEIAEYNQTPNVNAG